MASILHPLAAPACTLSGKGVCPSLALMGPPWLPSSRPLPFLCSLGFVLAASSLSNPIPRPRTSMAPCPLGETCFPEYFTISRAPLKTWDALSV